MTSSDGFRIEPAGIERFDDLAIMLGPRRPDASVCWCLSHRIDSATNRSLVGEERGRFMRDLAGQEIPPGVLAYDGPEVVGWGAVAPRESVHSLARSRTIPRIDDVPVWSIFCIRVRPGHRKRGVSRAVVRGAVDFAVERGATVVEAYPVDNQGAKVDLTMAFVGIRSVFESAGFVKAADTTSVSGGIPRVLMRLDLR